MLFIVRPEQKIPAAARGARVVRASLVNIDKAAQYAVGNKLVILDDARDQVSATWIASLINEQMSVIDWVDEVIG